jgi:hypothetical protein
MARISSPALTIVVTTSNALNWLPGALASAATCSDSEVIIVDDGSTDGTDAYLDALALVDGRLRALCLSGATQAEARNAAVALARAPLVAFLGAGDRWRTAKLSRQLELHRLYPDIGFSFTDRRRFTADGTALPSGLERCPRFMARHAMRREAFVLDSDAQAQIYAEPLVAASTVIARTDLLRAVGGFDEQLCSAEDWELWLHLAACAPVACIPQALADQLVLEAPGRGVRAAERLAFRRVAEAYALVAATLDPEAPGLCRRTLRERQAGFGAADRDASAGLRRMGRRALGLFAARARPLPQPAEG